MGGLVPPQGNAHTPLGPIRNIINTLIHYISHNIVGKYNWGVAEGGLPGVSENRACLGRHLYRFLRNKLRPDRFPN